MKKALVVGALFALAFGSVAGASPISLNTPGVVGVADMNSANQPANDPERLVLAQAILDLVGLGTFTPSPYPADDSNVIGYRNSTLYDYSGTLVTGFTNTTTNIVTAGYDYVLAKYDGPNAGYVLFYIPTYGTTLPQTASFAYWDKDKDGVPNEYGLSGWTVYNRTTVPDGGSVAMLLGAALVGLAGLRRFVK